MSSNGTSFFLSHALKDTIAFALRSRYARSEKGTRPSSPELRCGLVLPYGRGDWI